MNILVELFGSHSGLLTVIELEEVFLSDRVVVSDSARIPCSMWFGSIVQDGEARANLICLSPRRLVEHQSR